VGAAFAPLRARSLKVGICRSSLDATEHERTRTNHERDHCDHAAPARDDASTLAESRSAKRSPYPIYRGFSIIGAPRFELGTSSPPDYSDGWRLLAASGENRPGAGLFTASRVATRMVP
jgi:hypothetical protein